MTPTFKRGDRVRRVGAHVLGTVTHVVPVHAAGGVRARLRVQWDDTGIVGRAENRQLELVDPEEQELNALHVALALRNVPAHRPHCDQAGWHLVVPLEHGEAIWCRFDFEGSGGFTGARMNDAGEVLEQFGEQRAFTTAAGLAIAVRQSIGGDR